MKRPPARASCAFTAALAGLALGAFAYSACGGGGDFASSGGDAGREPEPGDGADGGVSCPTIRWLTRISGGGHDHPTVVVALDDGAVLVAGTSSPDAIFGVGSPAPAAFERWTPDAGGGDGGAAPVTPPRDHAFLMRLSAGGAVERVVEVEVAGASRISPSSVIARPGGGRARPSSPTRCRASRRARHRCALATSSPPSRSPRASPSTSTPPAASRA